MYLENIVPGQRWISNAESELGLGLILEVNLKRITVLYLACGEKRIYARDNAPLTRVKFLVGDIIENVDDVKLTVLQILEIDNLITYACIDKAGQEVLLDEMELNHHLQFNKPQDRLFAGQIDPSRWFKLRYQTWQVLKQLQQSPIRGLLGGRTSLIPHQLYIAQEATNRHNTRILLADEVGLGKTIEAGLIIHRRLINGHARRVLLLVPESLVHQWLVEMVRRFNLRFSIFNEDRCLEYEHENPFNSEQLILCSQDFFNDNPQRQQQALQAEWDFVVVDEAHHLQWQQHESSVMYQFVDKLSQITPNLILLTATPEQLGQHSHFARLRLLDPDRFHSFDQFVEEEQNFAPVAEAARLLIQGEPLPQSLQLTLKTLLKTDNTDKLLEQNQDASSDESTNQELINLLLDHHGTGRILFRNSRKTVLGFPKRLCHNYPLSTNADAGDDIEQDPYYLWLLNKLSELGENKALLICKQATTAIKLEHALKHHAGISTAVFHEDMSIIERDRAAAYFADPDSRARLLICSEIGSEGRNFQFVHHLILFDLPDNPDLLQQRIGRLDRIGQQHVIELHVPYLEGSGQQVLFHWYQDGLNAFSENRSASHRVYKQQQQQLEVLQQQFDGESLKQFIEQSAALSLQFETEMNNGRDQLLELNSCRQQPAQIIVDQIRQRDQRGDLWPYMEQVFDCYGVKTEFHSPDCYIINPGNHMRIGHFPELPEDGITVTIKRETALAREDMQFLSWEHPMTESAIDLILSSDTGNAVISVIQHPQLIANQFMLECLFIVECSAPPTLQIGRFLPATPIRVLINQEGSDLSTNFDHQSLIDVNQKIDPTNFASFINSQRQTIDNLLKTAQKQAEQTMANIINDGNQSMLDTLSNEIKRLVRLQKVNSNIKQIEIDQLNDSVHTAHTCIQSAQLKLDAVRFIVTS